MASQLLLAPLLCCSWRPYCWLFSCCCWLPCSCWRTCLLKFLLLLCCSIKKSNILEFRLSDYYYRAGNFFWDYRIIDYRKNYVGKLSDYLLSDYSIQLSDFDYRANESNYRNIGYRNKEKPIDAPENTRMIT